MNQNEKWCGKKNHEEPSTRIKKLEKQIKKLRQILPLTSNEVLRKKIERKSTKNEKEKLKNLTDQQLNRNEQLLYET